VINKADLAPDGSDVRRALEPIVEVYRRVGYTVLETSASNGEGIDALAELLSTGASVLVGPSGVGKSSLLNAINPDLNLRTRGVSARGGRGRHTTVGARLLHLKGKGWVVDTPGFSDVALWGIDPARLPDAFPEFRERAGECRFRTCRHLEEPGCAVKQALDRGEVDEGRHRSYRILAEEADQLPSW
jgi:ribosome biogenesis GTPase / thiamine phosphate phosphatase